MLFPTFGHISAFPKNQHLDLIWKDLCGRIATIVAKTALNAVIFATLKGKNFYPTREKIRSHERA